MLALCSMLLPCYYAQNNASIKCQSLEGLAEFQTITPSRFTTWSNRLKFRLKRGQITLEHLSIMANKHVFWSLREDVLTFELRFQTAEYLARLKSCPWVTRYYSQNFSYASCRNSVWQRRLFSMPKKPQPLSREASFVFLIAWLF